MTRVQPRTVHLADYTPPAYQVASVDLRFELGEETTLVSSNLEIRREPGADSAAPLVLDGRELTLEKISINEVPLPPHRYRVEEDGLVIDALPESFSLQIVTRIRPQDNMSLEGLYTSSGNFCTQCEPEGFRRITYYPDRPDVMAVFSATIVAKRDRYPVLLSNGNLVAQGELEKGYHFAQWEDPYPKPSYLFALVAGNLLKLEDTFTTASGRSIVLQIWVESHNLDKCDHAMRSLKKAMAWDEQTFGLEYDLDRYMLVAVDDFNMGAMENKGLNIFNSKYVLAKPETATDADYQAIEGVVGHEYFHNWTGNRVTCRDWFQLSLKEGLTVFRDQEFSADMTSRPIKRISDVRLLRAAQFSEDAGPMAHPVRPDAYVEINNFYTTTVYNKGAEVIRMLHTLLGAPGFRKGMDLYFARHDGEAVTTDDFVAAMADANERDFSQFKRWYTQAGTPVLTIEAEHDPAGMTCTVTVQQSCPPTPGQPVKHPFHIPLEIGLIGPQGQALPLKLAGDDGRNAPASRGLDVCEAEQSFTFTDIADKPVPSLLRGFSAPVRVLYDYADDELASLMAHDQDPFNRWEAGQLLAQRIMLGLLEELRGGGGLKVGSLFVEAFRQTLEDERLVRAFRAQALSLPAESFLADQISEVDPDAIHVVRDFLRSVLAERLRRPLLATWQANADGTAYRPDPLSVGRRSLKNLSLAYLATLEDATVLDLCLNQFHLSTNMTDALAALNILTHRGRREREEPLAAFYQRWQNEPLVIDKWFTLQATAPFENTLERVRQLMAHPAFNLRNPNRVRSLVGAFAHGNPVGFHAPSGDGYAFVADTLLEIDAFNPQVSGRLVGAFSRWRRYEPVRREKMRAQMERVLAHPGLSRDVYEVASKSLVAPSDEAPA